MSRRSMRRKVWFHRGGAVFWTLMVIPAFLWWQEAIWFVIAASLYANIKSDWGAAEAADDREVVDLLTQISRKLDRLEAARDEVE